MPDSTIWIWLIGQHVHMQIRITSLCAYLDIKSNSNHYDSLPHLPHHRFYSRFPLLLSLPPSSPVKRRTNVNFFRRNLFMCMACVHYFIYLHREERLRISIQKSVRFNSSQWKVQIVVY